MAPTINRLTAEKNSIKFPWLNNNRLQKLDYLEHLILEVTGVYRYVYSVTCMIFCSFDK